MFIFINYFVDTFRIKIVIRSLQVILLPFFYLMFDKTIWKGSHNLSKLYTLIYFVNCHSNSVNFFIILFKFMKYSLLFKITVHNFSNQIEPREKKIRLRLRHQLYGRIIPMSTLNVMQTESNRIVYGYLNKRVRYFRTPLKFKVLRSP